MKALPLLVVAAFLASSLCGCQSPLRSGGSQFSGYTKTALVRRLGLPAEIIVSLRGNPTHDLWLYYWQDRAGEIHVADFQFRSGRVEGVSYVFEPSGVLHTESEADFARIYQHKRELYGSTPQP